MIELLVNALEFYISTEQKLSESELMTINISSTHSGSFRNFKVFNIIKCLNVMYLILTLQVPFTLPSVFNRPGVAGAVL